MILRWLVVWGSMLWLAACQAPAMRPNDVSSAPQAWAVRQQALRLWTGFDLEGRIAAKGSGLSGSLSWQQRGEHFHLRLAGPFGSGALLIEGTPSLATIRGKDLDLTTTTPEQTLAERTGWQLPLAALRYWVLGLPAPGTLQDLLLDELGRPLQMTQSGWQLRYDDYPSDDRGIAERIIAHQGDTEITVILKRIQPQSN